MITGNPKSPVPCGTCGLRIPVIEGGFPHSEIHGSKRIRSSPWLIAAYYVLHRLSAPRHPPNALKTLDCSHYQCPPLGRGFPNAGNKGIDLEKTRSSIGSTQRRRGQVPPTFTFARVWRSGKSPLHDFNETTACFTKAVEFLLGRDDGRTRDAP